MKGTALQDHDGTSSKPPGTLFVSYSHQDKVWMQRLKVLLGGIQYDDRAAGRVGFDQVSIWHDNELETGDRWDKEIKEAMERMCIFVPLVSHAFFASWYVQNVELPRARERYDQGKIHVAPILLEDINLREKCSFLNQFSSLPAWGRHWRSYRSHQDAHRLIDDGLWEVIQKAVDAQNASAT